MFEGKVMQIFIVRYENNSDFNVVRWQLYCLISTSYILEEHVKIRIIRKSKEDQRKNRAEQ